MKRFHRLVLLLVVVGMCCFTPPAYALDAQISPSSGHWMFRGLGFTLLLPTMIRGLRFPICGIVLKRILLAVEVHLRHMEPFPTGKR